MTTYLIITYIVGLLITREVCLMIRTITNHNDKEDRRITIGLSLLSFIGLLILVIAHRYYRYKSFMKWMNRIFTILFITSMLSIITSCKKDNKQPQEPYNPPTPIEQYWLLGGDWKCIGGDTMCADLHISYCCTAYNGAKAVYNLSYPIWNYGKILTVSYYYKSDTIGFSNGSSGTNYKEVYFKRIK